MRLLSDHKGLTLVELVLVSGFLIILTLLIHETARVQAASTTRNSAQTTTQSDLRVWVSRMIQDIRESGYDPLETGGFGMLATDATEIRFTTDIDADGVVGSTTTEYGGFRLQDATLEAWGGGSNWRPLLPNVTHLEFRYYDSAGQEVTTASEAVSRVEIEISAQTESGGFAGLDAPILHRRGSVEVRNDLS